MTLPEISPGNPGGPRRRKPGDKTGGKSGGKPGGRSGVGPQESELQPRLQPQRPPDTSAPQVPIQPANPGGPAEHTEHGKAAGGPPPVVDGRFAHAAPIYEALLAACPADDRTIDDLRALGVAPDLIRKEGFGALYPGGHVNTVVASLRSVFGDPALLAAPGFTASPSGAARLDLPTRPLPGAASTEESANDPNATEPPFALVAYRAPSGPDDAPGPILAVEAMDLASGASAGSVLLGCARDGRDPRAGGANHIWLPTGPASRLQAVTDTLIEALRSTSAGVPCAGLRTPRSSDPGAGNDTLPELAGVDLRGRRILYAPGGTKASARTAREAAAATIARAGAGSFVLTAPPYTGAKAGASGSTEAIPADRRLRPGFGSFMLSLPEAERPGAFARLFLSPISEQLAGEDAGGRARPCWDAPVDRRSDADTNVDSSSPGEDPTQRAAPADEGEPENEGETDDGPPSERERLVQGAARIRSLNETRLVPFRAQLELSPPMPERGPKPTRRDRRWGNQVALFLASSAFASCMFVLAGVSAVLAFFAASQRAQGPLAAEPPVDEPLLLLPWFFGTVFEEVGTPMGRFAELLSPGLFAVLLALVPALLVGLPLAVIVADTKRRQRMQRVKLHQGRFFE